MITSKIAAPGAPLPLSLCHRRPRLSRSLWLSVAVVALGTVLGAGAQASDITVRQQYALSHPETQSKFNASIDRNFSDSTVRTILKDIYQGILRTNVDGTTATIAINGQNFAINSDKTFRSIAGTNSFAATINGHAVVVSTSSSTFGRVLSRDNVKLTIDGTTYLNASSGSINLKTRSADFLSIYNALGLTESRTVVDREVARATSTVVNRVISTRIASFLSPVSPSERRKLRDRQKAEGGEAVYADQAGSLGVSAGEQESGTLTYKVSAWANYNHSWLSNTNTLSAYDGDLNAGLMGSDVLINDQFLVGLTLGREQTSLKTHFNSGELSTAGFGVVPYAGVRFLDGRLVVSAIAGYTWLWSDSQRNLGYAPVSGKYDGRRVTAATDVTYNHVLDDWSISPSIGLSYASDRHDAYTDSSNSLQEKTTSYVGDLKTGFRAGYLYQDFLEFYTSQYWLYDLVPIFSSSARHCESPLGGCSNSRNELLSTIGVSWYYDERLTASLEGTRSFFREGVGNTSIVASARISF